MSRIYSRRRKISALIHFLGLLLLFFFFYNRQHAPRNPNLSRSTEVSFMKNSSVRGFLGDPVASCHGLADHVGYESHCEFVKVNKRCSPGGFIDYIHFFYCHFGDYPAVGFMVLALWMMSLFYLLGNTAADYFCCNLEMLSDLLKLPPTVAGVTLLPFGNGAPDVFASIAAFMGSSAGNVGLNSVLGGAVFVTCVVVGTVSLFVADKDIQIDRKCFIRDVGFFLLALLSLSLIMIVGKVTVLGAALFVLIYVVYAFLVAANEYLRKHARMLKLDVVTPLLPAKGSVFSCENDLGESAYVSFGDGDVPHLPPWIWSTNVAIYSSNGGLSFEKPVRSLSWNDIVDGEEDASTSVPTKLFSLMEMPLVLSRRLTIPIVEEERWSKLYAVASATISPVLLAFLLSGGDGGADVGMVSYVAGGLVGLVLGTLSLLYTKSDHPPRKFLLPWVLGGFVMSIAWFYIIANELVALLVSFGVILRINPSILGLTVLAWGNSMGDLMANVSLAKNGGDGVQVAMSGCYAGPMFNTLVGLGTSMFLKTCSLAPSSYVLPRDISLVYTMVFLMSGLLWALIILPMNNMQPNRMLGFGLLILYVIFLLARVCIAVGVLPMIAGLH
ncbi:putative cation/calcium exchanger 4 [Iris pallida]|uniref:Cation/calcium exchanger 4 n=1 Tax=Iris pallida TaxID=29817 RepID=A0AAX6GA46_IRIPA|nr:putative cation/calcium exchanger 4 [Iris pallida]